MKKFKGITFSIYIVLIFIAIVMTVAIAGLIIDGNGVGNNPPSDATNGNGSINKPIEDNKEPDDNSKPNEGELVIDYTITNDCDEEVEEGTLNVHTFGNSAMIIFVVNSIEISSYELSFECSNKDITFEGNDFITINTSSSFPDNCTLTITVTANGAKTKINLNLIFGECI